MTNLEWFNEIGMIAENEVWTKTSDLKGQIGVNLVIALRDDDFKKYSEKGFDWLLEEHKEPIKLKQWEKDLVSLYDEDDEGYSIDYNFSSFLLLIRLKEKGYFKGVTDTSMKIEDILKNCEVIDD